MSQSDELDLEGVHRLAAQLAVVLRPGDCVALCGDLGSGKTTFARALISRLLDTDGPTEIPSPSFALVQHYETRRMPVAHFDFYRLADPEEVAELGFEEALESGLVLVEWPEKAAHVLPVDHLRLTFADGTCAETRKLRIEGRGRWGTRLARLAASNDFLRRAGWHRAERRYLQGDASARAYVRLHRELSETPAGGATDAVLMDAPRQPDGPPVRDGRPYSAIAHLAEDVRPFVAVAGELRRLGLSAPAIYAADLDAGLLLIEDFGNRVFGREIAEGREMRPLWQAAVDVLLHLRDEPPPARIALDDGQTHVLARYDAEAMGIEVELLLDWFWPMQRKTQAPSEARQRFMAIWTRHFAALRDDASAAWVLRDFHSPNLMWLAGRQGIARVGLLDFQDAVRGHAAYDLVSLLQDARLDVPAEMESELLAYYCAEAARRDAAFDENAFRAAYARLGAQRNTKILGIFARLARRDGKPGYLRHMPRISAYLERNLAHPVLADLKAWFDSFLPAAQRVD